MPPTLRLGSTGPFVVQLQQGLNKLPSPLAALTPDGQFGSKTQTRVKEFQTRNSLVSDGIVGPLTWETFLALVGEGLGSGVPVVPSMPGSVFDLLRPVVLAIANSHMGKVDFSQMVNGRPRGIDFLIDMFRFTASVQLTDINFREGGTTSGAWTAVPWVGLTNQKKSWCGIFAIFCYRKAGIPVSWDIGKGGPVGPLQMASFSSNFAAGIKPGDVGAVATQSHHFLIESVNGPGPVPSLTTIDGNTEFGPIPPRTDHRVGKDNFNHYEFTQ